MGETGASRGAMESNTYNAVLKIKIEKTPNWSYSLNTGSNCGVCPLSVLCQPKLLMLSALATWDQFLLTLNSIDPEASLKAVSSLRKINNHRKGHQLLTLIRKDMEVKPTVALRAMLVGGIAAFAKIGGAMKAAGGAKLGAAAAAMTAAATAAVTGSKKDQPDATDQPAK
ncbi:Phosphonates import ATP-binding protein PhnC 2 [Bienertia sinuspersici]